MLKLFNNSKNFLIPFNYTFYLEPARPKKILIKKNYLLSLKFKKKKRNGQK